MTTRTRPPLWPRVCLAAGGVLLLCAVAGLVARAHWW